MKRFKVVWIGLSRKSSLKSLLLFGLRGMAAYAYHAAILGYTDAAVDDFLLYALEVLGNEWDVESLLPIVMKVCSDDLV